MPLIPPAAVKRSPSPEELMEHRNKSYPRWEGSAAGRGDVPRVMLALGGRGRLQSQVSDSPCCFTHWLTRPPPGARSSSGSDTMTPDSSRRTCCLHQSSVCFIHLFTLFTATFWCRLIATWASLDKYAGPGLESLSLQALWLQENSSCMNRPIRVMHTQALKNAKPTPFHIEAIWERFDSSSPRSKELRQSGAH